MRSPIFAVALLLGCGVPAKADMIPLFQTPAQEGCFCGQPVFNPCGPFTPLVPIPQCWGEVLVLDEPRGTAETVEVFRDETRQFRLRDKNKNELFRFKVESRRLVPLPASLKTSGGVQGGCADLHDKSALLKLAQTLLPAKISGAEVLDKTEPEIGLTIAVGHYTEEGGRQRNFLFLLDCPNCGGSGGGSSLAADLLRDVFSSYGSSTGSTPTFTLSGGSPFGIPGGFGGPTGYPFPMSNPNPIGGPPGTTTEPNIPNFTDFRPPVVIRDPFGPPDEPIFHGYQPPGYPKGPDLTVPPYYPPHNGGDCHSPNAVPAPPALVLALVAGVCLGVRRLRRAKAQTQT